MGFLPSGRCRCVAAPSRLGFGLFFLAWAGLKLLVCTGRCPRCGQAHSLASTGLGNGASAPSVRTNGIIPGPHGEMFIFGSASQGVMMSQLRRCYQGIQRGFLCFFLPICRKRGRIDRVCHDTYGCRVGWALGGALHCCTADQIRR